MMPDPTTILLVVILLAVGIVGGFVYHLHQAGVPKAQLLPQAALKGGDVLDAVQERVTAALAAWATAHPATLKAQYFDRDDFMQDIGRLPVAYVQGVRLDGAVVRGGDPPGVDYYLQPNGNVTTSAPK